MKSFKKGFTLIELLVVISIISLLSSIVLASLKTARSKANDARRLSDLRQVQIALELYRSDNNGYPQATSASRENSCGVSGDTSVMYGSWDNALSLLVSGGYIKQLPDDPMNASAVTSVPRYCYSYFSNPGGSDSAWADCVSMDNSTIYDINDYSYAFFYTPENIPTTGNKIYWLGNNLNNTHATKVCVLGPRRN